MGMDADVMPYVDMANIACGFHASDPQIMSKTVALAVEHDVTIGAHPGYPDLLGFGRRDIKFSSAEIINIVLYQVGALQAICAAHGTSVKYVKPHGALYNTMMRDLEVYVSILKAMSQLELDIPLMIMANEHRDQLTEKAKEFGVSLLFEAFCDRAYTDEGSLQSRQIEGAVHEELDKIVGQAKKMIVDQSVIAASGKEIPIIADTLCVHGDGELAVASVKRIREVLNAL
jgi:UPF0271 protein